MEKDDLKAKLFFFAIIGIMVFMLTLTLLHKGIRSFNFTHFVALSTALTFAAMYYIEWVWQPKEKISPLAAV